GAEIEYDQDAVLRLGLAANECQDLVIFAGFNQLDVIAAKRWQVAAQRCKPPITLAQTQRVYPHDRRTRTIGVELGTHLVAGVYERYARQRELQRGSDTLQFDSVLGQKPCARVVIVEESQNQRVRRRS